MLTALDVPFDTLDAGEQSFIANIREHGWFNTAVFGDEKGRIFRTVAGSG